MNNCESSGIDCAEKVYTLLIRKKPFLYRVDGNIYYIGCAVCRLCTSEETELFDAYQKEYRRLSEELIKYPNSLNHFSGSEINEILQRILTLPGSEFCCDKKDRAFNDLATLLRSQSPHTLQDLEEQIQDFLIALSFGDGAFYRFQQ